MGLGELYKPSGLALETAKAVLCVDNPYAVNVALGCTNGCLYCYGPLASRQGREKYLTPRCPNENPIDLISKQLSKGLDVDGVFISFLTDPYLPILEDKTEELVKFLLDKSIKTATLSKLGTSSYFGNWNGMTIVSPYKDFSAKYEPNVPTPDVRINRLWETHKDGLFTWVSYEPCPTQEIYPYEIKDIVGLWEKLDFVDFMIFGKWNYDKRAKTEKAREEYAEIVSLFEEFCHEYGIYYHVKSDTRKFIQPSLQKESKE